MSVQREEWLDTLRGVTISLVILHHSYLAMSVMLSQMDKTFFFPFYRLEAFLSIVRMPAFFMCSGILFAIPATRGWNWFFKKRLLWSLWIAALWGWLTLGLTILGFNIYPWGNPKLSFLTISLIDPVGNM
ncbi:acyltransferase family protein [Paracoccus sp. JM45]|uniref:acyltransferase family protein n=1 Tax=Paracoccus sp. JM45 TaxID=2283626 RepID=UPI000E6BF6F7|nr:acyltransferase family protein [Paracoccus sp. JM45]RJE78538.1 DUF1624 domain-containing protein [Paracoccus sp. JM45]